MMNFEFIQECLSNNQYQEAYDKITDLLKTNQNDSHLLFFHAVIDFIYLKKDLNLDYEELLKVISNKKNPDYNDALLIEILLADGTYHQNFVLEHGREAIHTANTASNLRFNLLFDLLFVVSFHLYETGLNDLIFQACEYLDELFTKFPNDIDHQHYLLKTNCLISLGLFEEVKVLLDAWERNLGSSGELAYSKALYFSSIEDNNYDKALEYLQKASNYEFDSLKIFEQTVDIYYKKKEYNKVIKLLKEKEESDPNNNQIKSLCHQLLLKTYLSYDYNDFYHALRIIEKDIRSGFNPSLKFLKANLINEKFLYTNPLKHDKRLKQCINLLLESYDILKESEVIFDLLVLLIHEHQFKEGLEYLNKYYDVLPNNGRKDYLMGGIKSYLGYSYDDLVKHFNKAYKDGYINELEYFDEVEYLIKNPKKLEKKLQYYSKNKLIDEYDAYSSRKMGYRFLSETFGFKQDVEKIKMFLSRQLEKEPNVSCSHTAWGRYLYYFTDNQEEVFKEYQKAYELFLTKVDECSCGAGALADAYYKGIGTNKNIEESKRIVLGTVKRLDVAPVNTVVYLYCFYAIKKEEGFDLKQAYEMLLKDYPFERYEVSRYMYLLIIEKLLELDSSNTKKMLKASLKYSNNKMKKYYLDNKDVIELYPSDGSF